MLLLTLRFVTYPGVEHAGHFKEVGGVSAAGVVLDLLSLLAQVAVDGDGQLTGQVPQGLQQRLGTRGGKPRGHRRLHQWVLGRHVSCMLRVKCTVSNRYNGQLIMGYNINTRRVCVSIGTYIIIIMRQHLH